MLLNHLPIYLSRLLSFYPDSIEAILLNHYHSKNFLTPWNLFFPVYPTSTFSQTSCRFRFAFPPPSSSDTVHSTPLQPAAPLADSVFPFPLFSTQTNQFPSNSLNFLLSCLLLQDLSQQISNLHRISFPFFLLFFPMNISLKLFLVPSAFSPVASPFKSPQTATSLVL